MPLLPVAAAAQDHHALDGVVTEIQVERSIYRRSKRFFCSRKLPASALPTLLCIVYPEDFCVGIKRPESEVDLSSTFNLGDKYMEFYLRSPPHMPSWRAQE